MTEEEQIREQNCRDFLSSKALDKIKSVLDIDYPGSIIQNFIKLENNVFGHPGSTFINSEDQYFFDGELILAAIKCNEFNTIPAEKVVCYKKVTKILDQINSDMRYTCTFGKSTDTENVLFIYTPDTEWVD